KGSPQMLIVRAYPCNAGDPAIIGVEFYIHEPASNGYYYGGSLCSLLTKPHPGTQDQYSCLTDGLVTSGNGPYVPSGRVQIGFWVSNAPNYGLNLTELTGTQ